MKILEYFAASVAASFLLFVVKDKIDNFFMYRARDIFRLKARKSRLVSTPTIPVILGFDAPTTVELETKATITTHDLAEMDGRTEEKPIYIAVNKHVFDVSSNRRKFGPGKQLHALAGHDASKAFATGCFKPKCVIGSISSLSKGQLRELARWDEYFAHNDQYPYVATLVDPQETLQSTTAATEAGLDSSAPEVIVQLPGDLQQSAGSVVAVEETHVTKIETSSISKELLEEVGNAETVNIEATLEISTKDDTVSSGEAEIFANDELPHEPVAQSETSSEKVEPNDDDSLPKSGLELGLESKPKQNLEQESLAEVEHTTVGVAAQIHPFDADDI